MQPPPSLHKHHALREASELASRADLAWIAFLPTSPAWSSAMLSVLKSTAVSEPPESRSQLLLVFV